MSEIRLGFRPSNSLFMYDTGGIAQSRAHWSNTLTKIVTANSIINQKLNCSYSFQTSEMQASQPAAVFRNLIGSFHYTPYSRAVSLLIFFSWRLNYY